VLESPHQFARTPIGAYLGKKNFQPQSDPRVPTSKHRSYCGFRTDRSRGLEGKTATASPKALSVAVPSTCGVEFETAGLCGQAPKQAKAGHRYRVNKHPRIPSPVYAMDCPARPNMTIYAISALLLWSAVAVGQTAPTHTESKSDEKSPNLPSRSEQKAAW
jgi:hypothetical protein